MPNELEKINLNLFHEWLNVYKFIEIEWKNEVVIGHAAMGGHRGRRENMRLEG